MPLLPKVNLKPGAVPKLLKSAAMQRKLVQEAKKATAGMDVEVGDPFVGANRARVTIHANSKRGGEQLAAKFRR